MEHKPGQSWGVIGRTNLPFGNHEGRLNDYSCVDRSFSAGRAISLVDTKPQPALYHHP
jgi:hypothetical protein